MLIVSITYTEAYWNTYNRFLFASQQTFYTFNIFSYDPLHVHFSDRDQYFTINMEWKRRQIYRRHLHWSYQDAEVRCWDTRIYLEKVWLSILPPEVMVIQPALLTSCLFSSTSSHHPRANVDQSSTTFYILIIFAKRDFSMVNTGGCKHFVYTAVLISVEREICV